MRKDKGKPPLQRDKHLQRISLRFAKRPEFSTWYPSTTGSGRIMSLHGLTGFGPALATRGGACLIHAPGLTSFVGPGSHIPSDSPAGFHTQSSQRRRMLREGAST